MKFFQTSFCLLFSYESAYIYYHVAFCLSRVFFHFFTFFSFTFDSHRNRLIYPAEKSLFFLDANKANGEGGIWTLAPLSTTYSLSRGAPSASLGTSPKCPLINIHDYWQLVQYLFTFFSFSLSLRRKMLRQLEENEYKNRRMLTYNSLNGEGGIRTHAPLRTNGFQDRLVMTTSIPLHIIFYCALNWAICILSQNPFTVNHYFYFFWQTIRAVLQFTRCCALAARQTANIVMGQASGASPIGHFLSEADTVTVNPRCEQLQKTDVRFWWPRYKHFISKNIFI